MSYAEMTEIAGDLRELTENELAMVAGGGKLATFVKDSIKVGLAAVGGAAFGPGGAIAGFLLATFNGLSIEEGARIDGKISGENGFVPTRPIFSEKQIPRCQHDAGTAPSISICGVSRPFRPAALKRRRDSSRECGRHRPRSRSG